MNATAVILLFVGSMCALVAVPAAGTPLLGALEEKLPLLAPAPAVASDGTPASALPTVRVCVVDSGVRASHHDLAPYMEPGLGVTGDGTSTGDILGHGTQVASRVVAGFVSAAGPTVANLRIVPVRVLESDGRFFWSNVVKALEFCEESGASIVTLSLGADTGDARAEAKLADLRARGIVILAAAGNGGPCGDCVLFPARYDSVIAVGCTDASGRLCRTSATGGALDLTAEGDRVNVASFSSDTAHARATGTSLAAPFVAGVLAALGADSIDTTSGLPATLVGHLDDAGAPGWDASYGWGRL